MPTPTDTERRLARLEAAVVELARRSSTMTGQLPAAAHPMIAELVKESDARHRALCDELGVAHSTERALARQLQAQR